MKNKKARTLSLILLGFGLTTVNAQQATTASGGNASGSGGTIAYSLGQVVYITNTGAAGSVAQGVQQAYEISITTGLVNTEISLNIQVFPNPTSDFIQLKVESEKLQDLSYQLIDLNGKLIEDKKITCTAENIHTENLPSATYFLKVINNNNEVKIFKIIKN
jgi:hypothetical protein